MATEIDEVLKRYTDPATGSFHGVSFVAIDSKGMSSRRENQLSIAIGSTSPLLSHMIA